MACSTKQLRTTGKSPWRYAQDVRCTTNVPFSVQRHPRTGMVALYLKKT
ncbi:MAG: hypothetical protein KDJ42_00595 [Alphaproteobacteria bacterium]|nr:hypothetical protein [Alphaproteobacteria bacterium]